MNKETIYNNYAIEQGYDNWEMLMKNNFKDEIQIHINAVTDLIQKELLKRVLESALIRHDYNLLNCPNSGESQKRFKGVGANFYEIDQNSILNTEIL